MALRDSAGGKVHQEGIRNYAQAHGMSGGLRVKHRMEPSVLSKGCKIRLIAHSAVQTTSSTAASLCWSTQALSVDSAIRALHPVTRRQEGCGFLLPVPSCTESYLLMDLQRFVPNYHNTKLTSLGCLPLLWFFFLKGLWPTCSTSPCQHPVAKLCSAGSWRNSFQGAPGQPLSA